MKSLYDDKNLIRSAMKYRSSTDSCNSVYMGSMATAGLYHILGLQFGLQYGDRGFEEALVKVGRKTVNKLLEKCDNIIKYMAKNPRTKCECCGQIIPARNKETGE